MHHNGRTIEGGREICVVVGVVAQVTCPGLRKHPDIDQRLQSCRLAHQPAQSLARPTPSRPTSAKAASAGSLGGREQIREERENEGWQGRGTEGERENMGRENLTTERVLRRGRWCRNFPPLLSLSNPPSLCFPLPPYYPLPCLSLASALSLIPVSPISPPPGNCLTFLPSPTSLPSPHRPTDQASIQTALAVCIGNFSHGHFSPPSIGKAEPLRRYGATLYESFRQRFTFFSSTFCPRTLILFDFDFSSSTSLIVVSPSGSP